MTLFSTTRAKAPKTPALPRDRSERRVPTGTLRLVESSADRAASASSRSWQSLVEAVRRSSSARLTLLNGRSASDRVTCPWERITGCAVSCRCGGSGTVSVEFLRRHYTSLADEIASLAQPEARRGR